MVRNHGRNIKTHEEIVVWENVVTRTLTKLRNWIKKLEREINYNLQAVLGNQRETV